ARRVRAMTLPAELQWSHLPLQALAGDRFTVAGKVLPTYEVGGDLFDLSWGPRGPWVAVFDAVGHGLRSSLLAHAGVGTTRHARRIGLDLVGQAEMADRFRWVNAGHPPPLLLRDGAVHELTRPSQRPLGLLDETAYVVHSEEVRAGDRPRHHGRRPGRRPPRRRLDERAPEGRRHARPHRPAVADVRLIRCRQGRQPFSAAPTLTRPRSSSRRWASGWT
ncbi:MAG TPA: SpoIIE family protein phosphatase, partial [Actinomycetales bacterium]|nr:SpoIIE family protein phosphatase [Actinomycetales bacterium]